MFTTKSRNSTEIGGINARERESYTASIPRRSSLHRLIDTKAAEKEGGKGEDIQNWKRK